MTWMSLGFVFLMAQAVVLGKPPIHKWHYAQIEVVFAATRDLATQGAAVQVLEKVALGQAATIDSEAERHVSLPAGTLKDPGFISPSVRELAVQRLGETGNPEVLQFLRAFQAEYAGPNDFGNRIWKAVQVAIRAAQFAHMIAHTHIANSEHRAAI